MKFQPILKGKRMKRTARYGAMALALTLGLAACGSDKKDVKPSGSTNAGETTTSGAPSGDPLKVAFVYIGPVGDGGWTDRHDAGREEMEKKLGDKVDVTVLEDVKEGPASEKTFADLARKGNKLIFATSFGYGDPMLKVAKDFPDTCFEWATGYKTADNLGTYFGAAEEARYLSGIAAATASKSGKIGYVAAFPIPEVLRGINAFTLGARSVNPDATVQVVWTSTWFNPKIEGQAAESLVAKGVDVLAQHQDSTAVGEAAKAANIKWVGYNDDKSSVAPDAWLTAPVWNWGPYYTKTTEGVLEGKCDNSQYYGTMADGLVGLAPYGSSVDQATQEKIDALADKIVDGSFKPFTGPIKDQSGKEILKDKEVAELGALLGTDYFVEGVIGEIPKK